MTEDQYRDSCVDRQNKKRKVFKGNPNDPIRVSFYDKDGLKVNDVTRSEANCIAKLNPPQLFYFQDGNGYQRELLIQQVNELTVVDDALPKYSGAGGGCPTDPQLCGPPRVQFSGGMGIGAMANAVVSPNSSSIIGFDIVNPGFNYMSPPTVSLVDECGYGSGGSLLAQIKPYVSTATTSINAVSVANGTTVGGTGTAGGTGTTSTSGTIVGGTGGETTGGGAGTVGGIAENGKGGYQIKNIVVTSPGDGYLSAPNGALGGNGRVWKDVGEGYVKTSDGRYYVAPRGLEPPNLPPGDSFVPPQPKPLIDKKTPTYPVIIELEEVYVVDPGFGYEIGDTLEVVSDDGTNKGAIIEPVINDRGQITQVKVVKPGIGFIDLPEIRANSPRGYNVKLIPVLKVTPIANIPPEQLQTIPAGTQLISVVDCVGRIPPKTEFDRVPQ